MLKGAGFERTPGYRAFIEMMGKERARRPAALRDVLCCAILIADDRALVAARRCASVC